MGTPNLVSGVEYGGIPCNIPEYQMNFPATALYEGVPQGTPVANPQGIDLDLWYIQWATQQVSLDRT